jgi:hypothetical protein
MSRFSTRVLAGRHDQKRKFQELFSRLFKSLLLSVKALKEFLISLGVVSISVYVGYLVFRARQPIVILEPISVPQHFAELGFTSEVVTEKVRERLDAIRTSQEVASASEQLAMMKDSDFPDIEIPEIKLSPQVIVDVLRKAFGKEQVLSGAITYETSGGTVKVQSRMSCAGHFALNSQSHSPLTWDIFTRSA